MGDRILTDYFQCCWADCEATENLQKIHVWGLSYCPTHIEKARSRSTLAKKGPAYTDRHLPDDRVDQTDPEPEIEQLPLIESGAE